MFNIGLVWLLWYIVNNYVKAKRCDILDRVNSIPVPVLITEYTTNSIACGNDLFYEMIHNDNIIKHSISTLNIFDDFNDYLQIKHDAEESYVHSRRVILNSNNAKVTVDITYNMISIANKKYIIITFDNKTAIIDYIKYLGVFTNIIEKSNEGIIIAKFENGAKVSPTVLYANDSINNITGYTKDEILSKSLLDSVFTLNVKEEAFDKIFDAVQSAMQTTVECEYKRKDGSSCWISVDIIPIDKSSIVESLNNLNKYSNVPANINLDLTSADFYVAIKQKDISEYKKCMITNKMLLDKIGLFISNDENKNEVLIDSFIDTLKNSNDNNSLDYILAITGEILKVDRISVNVFDENINEQKYHDIYEWTADTLSPKMKIEDVNSISANNLDSFNLYADILSGKTSTIKVGSINSLEFKTLFNIYNIKSGLFCPIYDNDNQVIALMSLYDCNDENRNWDSETIKVNELASKLQGAL